MEYIEGKDLATILIPDKPLPEAIAIKYIKQTGTALQLIHDNSLLPRIESEKRLKF